MNPIRTSAQRCMIAFTPPVQCVSVNGRQPLCNRWEEALHFFPQIRDRLAIAREMAQQASLEEDRKSTRLNSSHLVISYAVFCLKKKKNMQYTLYCQQVWHNGT